MKYEVPACEIVKLNNVDIITCSGEEGMTPPAAVGGVINDSDPGND